MLYWYAFQGPSELRATLLHSKGESLLSEYLLWRFEAEDFPPLVLATKAALPERWSEKTELSRGELEEKQILSSLSGQDSSIARGIEYKVTFQSEKGLHSGNLCLLRKGSELIGALGLDQRMEKDQLAWVVFSLPKSMLERSISDHLTLNNFELRCSNIKDDRCWLWVRNPDLYLVMKFQELEHVTVYQSYSEAKQVFFPWGYRSVLGAKIQVEKSSTLLLLDMEGDSFWLDTSFWWLASDTVTLKNPPVENLLELPDKAPSVPIKVRYSKVETSGVPSLWMLRGNDADVGMNTLFVNYAPEERAAISLFAGLDSLKQKFYVLRDDRLLKSSPLFSANQAVGFLPYLPKEGLFLQQGFRVFPSMPPDCWRREFALESKSYTLLEPISNGEGARLWRLQLTDFAPLESFASYQFLTNREPIALLTQNTVFDIMFEPKTVQGRASRSKASETIEIAAKPSKRKPVIETAAKARKKKPSKKQESISVSSAIELMHSGKDNKLELIEQKLKRALKTGQPLTPFNWIALAAAYINEFSKNQEERWLREALKALDQVLALDRFMEGAIEQEWKLFEVFLKFSKLPFDQQMACIGEVLDESNSLRIRVAFRMRARMLLSGKCNEQEAKTLRYHFYRDLVKIEDELMTLEYHIYVAGCAQYLGDHEMLERARFRYRRMLQDQERVQYEMPAIQLDVGVAR